MTLILVDDLNSQDLAFGAAKAEQNVSQAIQAGAFRFLHSGILTSPAFEDEPLPQKELYAQILNHLSMDFLDAEPGRCVAVPP